MQFLLSSDFTPAGRCDTSMLTQQQMVELLFTPYDPNKSREDLKGDPDDACTWEGVECTEAGDISDIEWHSWVIQLKGSIDFKMFPMTVKFIKVYFQDLYGEIDTTAFPESLEYLCLAKCFFTGTIDLGSLPPRMQFFQVSNNKITEVRNVQNFPDTMQCLMISEKHIVAKTIHVGALPENNLKLNFRDCGFSEVICARESDVGRVQI